MSAGNNGSRNGTSGDGESATDRQAARDADQTARDAEQTVADSDQKSSDKDQLAADRDIAGDGPVDAERCRVYKASTTERRLSTAERAAAAVRRGETASERLDAADRRDEASLLRDLAAQARDRAAEERDRVAALADPTGPAAEARARAAADRERAARDRERAASERQQAALDRAEVRAALTEAHLDELTGTYRRGQGTLELQQEINRARHSGGELVLAFVDVDGLKWVNDRGGHAAGDAVLIEVAETIRSKLRSYDPVVRFGGDEFVCAFSNFHLDGVRRRFEEIEGALEGTEVGSISVGLAKLEAGDTLDDLTQRGDAALYAAKRRKHGNRPVRA